MAYSVDKLSTIDLGRQGENLARTVEIDVSSLLAQWPDAIISLLCKRKHDTVPYVAVTEVKDGMLIWPITSVETEAAGDGKIELRAVCGEIIAKSMTAVIRVTASLTGSETEAPDAAQGWVDQVLAAGNGVEANAIRAEEAAEEAEAHVVQAEEAVARAEEVVATIGDSVDQAQEASRQAGQEAAAAEVSAEQARQIADDVTAEAERIETAVADAELAADKIDGMKVSAETLESGVPATVTISDDGTVKTISFGIPKGDPGEKPVRGEDYWTAEDKEQVVSEAVAETLEQVKTISFYFCSESEIDENGQPVIDAPDNHTFYLVPSGEEEPNLFIEWVYLNEKWERFGSATIDLSGYVRNTDYATAAKAGVAKFSNAAGFLNNQQGTIQIFKASDAEINAKTNEFKPIVPYNLDYAVKKALADSKLVGTDGAWTDEEKVATRELLGAGKIYKTSGSYGLGQREDGTFSITKATDELLSLKANHYRPVVPSNLDYAVKVGVTTNTIPLTEEEQTAAQEWLGTGKLIDDSKVVTNHTWSSQQLLEKLTVPFDVSAPLVQCYPVENSPLSVTAEVTPVQHFDWMTRSGETTQVTTTGKNLLNPLAPASNGNNDVVSTLNSVNQTTTLSGTLSQDGNVQMTTFELSQDMVDTDIAVSFEVISGNIEKAGNGNILFSLFTDDNSLFIRTQITSSVIKGTCFTGKLPPSANGTYRLMLQCYDIGMVFDDAVVRYQIEAGSSASSYEPYTGTLQTPHPNWRQPITQSIQAGNYHVLNASGSGYWKITLDTPLDGIDDCSDVVEINAYTGQYRVLRRIFQKTLTGNESWSMPTGVTEGYSNYRLSSFFGCSPLAIQSEHFGGFARISYSSKPYANRATSFNTMDQLIVQVENAVADYHDQTDMGEWKAFLKAQEAAGTPVVIRYAVEEPVVTIGQAELVASASGLTVLSTVTMGLTVPDTDHPCEITVADQVTVTRCGKNLIDTSVIPSGTRSDVSIQYIPEDDSWLLNGTTTATLSYGVYLSKPVRLSLGANYTLSTTFLGGSAYTPEGSHAVFYLGHGDAVNSALNWQTVTIGEQAQKVMTATKQYVTRIWFYISKGVELNNVKVKLQFEQGSAATLYESYQGFTHNVDLPDGFDGGSVCITEGVASEEWEKVVLNGTEGWLEIASYNGYRVDNILQSTTNKAEGKCTHTPVSSGLSTDTKISIGRNNKSIYFTGANNITDVEDVTSFKAYLAAQYAAGTPVTVYYKAASPVETSLTPQTMPSLPGVNTVMTDTQSLRVTGRADPIHTITTLEERIAALENAATTT